MDSCPSNLPIEEQSFRRVDPQAWLADTLEKLVNLRPTVRIDELLPWAYRPKA
jgi:hypothetical protein